MHIRMAAVVACVLTLGITPAAADTITTVSAFPSVIQAGETARLTLIVSGDVSDFHFFFQGAYWEAMPWANDVTFYDGLGGSSHFSSDFFTGLQTAWTIPVTYPDAGTFYPRFDADIVFRLTRGRSDPSDCPNNGHAFCLTFVNMGGDYSTSVTVNNLAAVPGPIIGTGLPGVLLLAACGLLFTYRRRSSRSACI